MHEMGVGDRLAREGLRHDGLYLACDGARHHIDLAGLTGGRAITIYGQGEVVKDLIDARIATGRPLHFDVSNVSVHDIDSEHPSVRYHVNGEPHELACDFIAGCDGFHGICRPSIPAGALCTLRERPTPFAWLGILAEAAPVVTGARLQRARERLRAVQHAIAARDATVPAMRGQRRSLAVVRRSHLERADHAAANRRRLATEHGADPPEGHRRDAQLRRRSHAVRPALPGWRRRAHRAADRREGAESRGGRRVAARARARGVLRRRHDHRTATRTRSAAFAERGAPSGSRGG